MKKTWISILVTVLLVTMVAPLAFASNQGAVGDLGGEKIKEALAGTNNKGASGGTYQKADSSVSYLPEAGEEIPDYSKDIPWEDDGDLSNKPWTNNNVPEGAWDDLEQVDVEEEDLEGEGEEEVPEEVPEKASAGTQSLDWYGEGQALLTKNPSIRIYDINSGVSWNAKYINGKNHADIIPASKADAEKIEKNKITGSYVRRPVLVTINGTQYAGSMYAVGHGETSYCNYFTGVMCIHFTGSQTHGTKRVDSDHQNAIKEALQYGN